MDISVLVPIYKVEKYVERCLRSLFNQSKTDGVEFILVNDGTPDGSMEVVRRVVAEFPQLAITILEHEVNRGLPNTRQTAFDKATGDYIIHIDSDDWCEPTMLEDLYNAAISEGADIVCCDIFEETKDGSIIKKQNYTSTNGIECAKSCFLYRVHPAMWNKLVKRQLYTEHNIVCDNNLTMGEDVVVTVRLFAFANRVIHLPKAYYHYMQNNDSSICTTWGEKQDIDLYVKSIKFLEVFIRDNKLEEEFRKVLIERKLRILFEVLAYPKCVLRKQFVELYPEVHPYIHTINFTSSCMKFGMVQATRGRLYIFDTIYKMTKLKSAFVNLLKK